MTNIILSESPKGDNNLAWIVGEGDSMRGVFNPGDPLLVDINVKRFIGDAIYAFQVGESTFIKQLQRVPEGIAVISANPDYETWYITPDMQFEVVGQVVKAYKSESL